MQHLFRQVPWGRQRGRRGKTIDGGSSMAGEAAARSETSAGFTIIELVVAMTILVIALSGAAKLFGNAITVSGNTRARVVAQHLATQQIEKVRGTAADPTKFASIVKGNSVTTQ